LNIGDSLALSSRFTAVLPDGRIVSGGGRQYVDGSFEHDGDYAVRLWRLPDFVSPQAATTPFSGVSFAPPKPESV